MAWTMKRPGFYQVGDRGMCALCRMQRITAMEMGTWRAAPACDRISGLVSPGCRGTKVRVAKVYLGTPQAHWPTPKMDLTPK